MTAPHDLSELKAIVAGATEGPWSMFELIRGAFEVCRTDNYALGGICVPHRREDALFIAAARTFIPELIARVERLEADVARKDEALTDCIDTLALVERPAFVDPQYGDAVKRLGDAIGYGALMASASASWREKLAHLAGGEYVAGPCHGTVVNTLRRARAALSPTTPEAVDEPR